MLLVALPLLLVVASCTAQRVSYCLASDYEPNLRFGTKTAYEFVKGKESNQHVVPYCRPIQFWSFNRHGTRLPSTQLMEELPRLEAVKSDVISNYEERRTAPDTGRLCDQDLENLKQWGWNRNFTRNYANDLTYQGYDDIKFLAKRWQTKFPDLLPSVYSPRKFSFRYTDKRRTKDSYRAFADGLFGRDAANALRPPQVNPNDTILQPNEFCDEWIRNVKNNPETQEQNQQFRAKEEFKSLIMNVSNHLGFRYPIDESLLKNIYEMCRFDKAWEINKNSPWCAAFNKDQLNLLEYSEDLKYYYESGYGNPTNKKIGCTPIADFMAQFKKMIEHPEQDQPSAIVYFSHSVMIQTLATAMGIAEDSVPLTSDNYHTPNMMRRMWRTSLIDPFASNIAAVLYKCEEGDAHRVMFFHNEKPVDFNDCRVGLCSWDVVKKKFEDIANNCNLEFCYQNSAGISVPSYLITVVTLLILGITKFNYLSE